MAMANHIFEEPAPGVIAHTAASKVLAEDDELQAWIGFNTDEIFPAAAHTLQALQAHPEATSAVRTGFQFAYGTVDKEPIFTTVGRDPARARRVGRAMASLTGGEGYEVAYLVDDDGDSGGGRLADVDARAGTLVDLGGSHGFVCVALAQRYRRMRFVVQDLPRMIESAPRPVCGEPQVAERIELAVHDFFTEQPVRGADGEFSSPKSVPLAERARERLSAQPPGRLTERGNPKSTSSAGSCTTGPPPTPCASYRPSSPP